MQVVDDALRKSALAFKEYKKLSLRERALFMRAIAKGLGNAEEKLLAVSNRETHLGEARLRTELVRTIFQLNSYAVACEEGNWLDIKIDLADPDRNPPGPDLRKMLVPLGPVAVFGASNFPFAYSTAGGDTACALAAGCSVVVKAHPAHEETSQMVAGIIEEAIMECQMPSGVFIHLRGGDFAVGKAIVEHPLTKAVGFTGSFEGGKALFDLANKRPEPIPVFAEMGSVNPVFILPGKLKEDANKVASMLSTSVTLSAGQFCTNPGIMVGVGGAELDTFKNLLGQKIELVLSQTMLHPGIAKNFKEKRRKAIEQEGVSLIGESRDTVVENGSHPTIATALATTFLANPLLHTEIFGPYSLLVECAGMEEMKQIADALEGQLTCSIMATDDEVENLMGLTDILKEKCGRLILNGVPTGVEVAPAMQHGGPYPATTDSRFTSVGADGIKRFARPVCFQNWSDSVLPDELKNENPLGLWRMVNGKLIPGKV